MIWMRSARCLAASSLLTQRYPGGDLLLRGILDALPKADMTPAFPLSTKPDLRVVHCAHNDAGIAVTPLVRGLAAVFDEGILNSCNSRLMAAINAGRVVGRTLQLTAHDPIATGSRETSGDCYQRLRNVLERLAGFRITTTIVAGARATTTGFGLIEGWQIERRKPADPMVQGMVTLSDWPRSAVFSKAVLTLSRDCFRLRDLLERRIPITTLCLRSGRASLLHTATINTARAMMPGCDIHALTAEWKAPLQRSGGPRLRWPDADFLGWLRKRQGKV